MMRLLIGQFPRLISMGPLIRFKIGGCFGTNNKAKMIALKLILTLAAEYGISNIQIFCDSLLVIKGLRSEYTQIFQSTTTL